MIFCRINTDYWVIASAPTRCIEGSQSSETNHSNFVRHYNNVFVKLHVELDTQRVFMESMRPWLQFEKNVPAFIIDAQEDNTSVNV